jgi:hypothetical protein
MQVSTSYKKQDKLKLPHNIVWIATQNKRQKASLNCLFEEPAMIDPNLDLGQAWILTSCRDHHDAPGDFLLVVLAG